MTAREVLAEIEQRASEAERHVTPCGPCDGGLPMACTCATDPREEILELITAVRAQNAALRAVLDQAEYVLELAEEQGDDDFEGWAPEALAKDVQQTITDALNGVTAGTDQ